MGAIIGIIILIVVAIGSLVYWHKKIDSETTWIYGIYVIIQVIFWGSVLIALAQYWSTQ